MKRSRMAGAGLCGVVFPHLSRGHIRERAFARKSKHLEAIPCATRPTNPLAMRPGDPQAAEAGIFSIAQAAIEARGAPRARTRHLREESTTPCSPRGPLRSDRSGTFADRNLLIHDGRFSRADRRECRFNAPLKRRSTSPSVLT